MAKRGNLEELGSIRGENWKESSEKSVLKCVIDLTGSVYEREDGNGHSVYGSLNTRSF